MSGGGQPGVGADGVHEAAILALHVDDERARGADVGQLANQRRADSARRERVDEKRAERVLADAPDDVDAHADAGQVEPGVRRATAHRKFQPLGQHQLAAAGRWSIGALT